jgi:hypothetical protein
MVRFLGTSEGHQGKRDQGKEPDVSIESPSLWLIFASGGSTPHISAALKFDTIQAIVKQFGQAVDFQKL